MKKPGTTKYSLDLIRPSHLHSSLAILQHVTCHHCLLHWEWPGAGKSDIIALKLKQILFLHPALLWSCEWIPFSFSSNKINGLCLPLRLRLDCKVLTSIHQHKHWYDKFWSGNSHRTCRTCMNLLGKCFCCQSDWGFKNIGLHAAPASLCGSSWRGSRWVRFWCFDVSQQSMNVPRMLWLVYSGFQCDGSFLFLTKNPCLKCLIARGSWFLFTAKIHQRWMKCCN